MMSTDLLEANTATVSADEAEAIFELWAKRQAETEALRSRLTIQDLAESMSVSPSEVEMMLRLVRSMPKVAAREVQTIKRKKKRSGFLIFLAVLFWLAILIAAFGVTFSLGVHSALTKNSYSRSLSSFNEGRSFVDENGVLYPQSSDLAVYLPSGFTADFQGYQLEGKSKSASLTEENIEYGLRRLIEKLEARSSSYVSAQIPFHEYAAALRAGDISGLRSAVRFEDLTLRQGDQVLSAKIPVMLGSNPSLEEVVQGEMDRRLRLLANKALRLTKNVGR